MEIKTKYNINDKIAVKDYKDNIILTTINRIETYATDTNLDIKYITNYGVINENQTININEFLNKLNDTNTKKKDNPIEVITMTFTPVEKGIKSKHKPKYNIGELIEYYYKGNLYISIIESININDKNIIYKIKNDDREFSEKEIKSVELDVNDYILYIVPYKTDKIMYYGGIITSVCFDHVVVRTADGHKTNVQYNQILRRI